MRSFHLHPLVLPIPEDWGNPGNSMTEGLCNHSSHLTEAPHRGFHRLWRGPGASGAWPEPRVPDASAPVQWTFRRPDFQVECSSMNVWFPIFIGDGIPPTSASPVQSVSMHLLKGSSLAQDLRQSLCDGILAGFHRLLSWGYLPH